LCRFIIQKSLLIRDFPLEKKAVIPAKAGIQFIEKRLRSRSTLVPCPLRGLFFLLDFRLRGNDGSNGKSGLISLVIPNPVSFYPMAAKLAPKL
jgi:hypothetical protein